MAKTIATVLTIINVLVAALVIYLSMTVPEPQDTGPKCDITYSDTDVNVSCSGRDLTGVPKSFPGGSTRINLRVNKLSNITEDSFGCLEQLRVLDLQKNRIRFLERGSFRCFPKLSQLFLSNNWLNYSYESLPVGLFSPLKHLQELRLDERFILSISKNVNYPEMTFMDLTNIESLTLSTTHSLNFGISFSKMIHLRNLHLAASWFPLRIRNDTFAVFSHHDINTLEIGQDGIILEVDLMSLRHLPHLQTLILHHLQVCLQSVLESLHVFSGKNMSTIIIQGYHYRLEDKYRQKCNMVLSSNVTKQLLSICVKNVSLRAHGIRFIQRGAFIQEPFAECVKYLDLSSNCIIANTEMYVELQDLKNLAYLAIEQDRVNCVKVADMNSVLKFNSSENGHSEFLTTSDDGWNQPIRGLHLDCMYGDLNISIPKSLKILHLSGLFNQLRIMNCIINVQGGENLTDVDLSLWNLHTSNTQILGVKNLRFLDFTQNFFDDFADFMFHVSPNLDTLYLVRTSDGVNSPSFSLQPRKLKHLVLQSNAILYFPFKPEELFNLSDIDLSYNFIRYFSSEIREGLDQIIREGRKMTLDLTENVLNCGCGSISFVQWMVETDVQFKFRNLYKCMNEDGELVHMPEFPDSFLKQWRKCNSRFWLGFAVSVSFLLITVLVIGMMVDKYSLRLKCMLLQWFGLKFKVPKRGDFLYDVFVYYSSKDDHTWVCNTFRQKLEEEKGLRLCIPDRDFIPGACTAEEILEAINNSWKTVVYMTEVFLEDELCFFTLSSAVYASTNEMPNRLILLYSNEIFNQPLPPIVTQLLDGDDNFMLEELEELEQWDILYNKTLNWV